MLVSFPCMNESHQGIPVRAFLKISSKKKRKKKGKMNIHTIVKRERGGDGRRQNCQEYDSCNLAPPDTHNPHTLESTFYVAHGQSFSSACVALALLSWSAFPSFSLSICGFQVQMNPHRIMHKYFEVSNDGLLWLSAGNMQTDRHK